MKILAALFLSATIAIAATTNNVLVENLPSAGVPAAGDVIVLYHNTGSSYQAWQMPVSSLQTFIQQLQVADATNAQSVPWGGLTASNSWVMSQDPSASLLISNTASHAVYTFLTNGDFVCQSSNNPSAPTFIQEDESEWGQQGDGILGDDCMHITGNEAFMELGGTGTTYWDQRFGFLPSWIFLKNNDFGYYSSQDLEIIPHANGAALIPYAIEFQTNGCDIIYSNLTVGGTCTIDGALTDSGETVNGLVTALQSQGNVAFANTSPPYSASGGGLLALSAYQTAIAIVETSVNGQVGITWDTQGSQVFFEWMSNPGAYGNYQGQQWSLTAATNGITGLYEDGNGQCGSGTNFNVAHILFSDGISSTNQSGGLVTGSAGVTNTLNLDMRIFVMAGNGVWFSNTVTHAATSFGTISQMAPIILQPGEALIGSSMTIPGDLAL